MKKRSEKADQSAKKVRSLSHSTAKRKHIPTAQRQPFMTEEQQKPIQATYKRPNAAQSPEMKKAIQERNPDLDPQLVWEGKDKGNADALSANAPPIYIQEKIHPKALIDDLIRESQKSQPDASPEPAPDLFADYDGLPKEADKIAYYQHSGGWQNRMILGDSLLIMASLLEREGMAGKAQVFYFDPPYGIKFNSNFQWTTKSRAVKDGEEKHIPRQPEQVKAFRDTWKDGISSYLSYMRDRLTLARELLNETGSIFLQIGDENVHRMRALLDEVFGDKNFVNMISVQRATNQTALHMPRLTDYILWFAKNKEKVKFRRLFRDKSVGDDGAHHYNQIRVDDTTMKRVNQSEHPIDELCHPRSLTSSHEYSRGKEPIEFQGDAYLPGSYYWSSSPEGIQRLGRAGRLHSANKKTLSYVRKLMDFPVSELANNWVDTMGNPEMVYIVQTHPKIIQRCVLMASDAGDLVIDPTCGSGTTAYVSEQWGRRWIVMDTSRVALALARARMMGAKFPYYTLADSKK